VSALLVVTLRDIIRCGLALIVSFASLAGIYALLGEPARRRHAGARLHRRHQHPDPVRDQ